MRTLALVLIGLLLPSWVYAACVNNGGGNWTSDSANASVASCVSQAASGNTITVTGSGSVSWSWTSTKSLHIIGPGKANLTITGGFGFSPTVAEATKVFELSGFTFSGNDIFHPTYPNSSTPITGLKIHDNAFNNASVRAIWWPGLEFGVLYNNTFANNNIAISIIGAGSAGENYPHDFGSANYLYVEDNTFGNGISSFVSEQGQGGRIVFRHNTITGYTCGGCEVWDLHGDQGTGGTTISAEFYHNTVNDGGQRWMHHRGGQAIIANNTISSGGWNFTEYRSWGGNGICSPYPAPGQINNSFYFNNIVGGSNQLPTFSNGGSSGICGGGGEAVYLVLNRDYWRPTFGLASARPATCTANNDTFYGSTDTDVIYKCTATNTWTPFFTPYTYPHPLRGGGSSSDLTPPSAPTNLRVS